MKNKDISVERVLVQWPEKKTIHFRDYMVSLEIQATLIELISEMDVRQLTGRWRVVLILGSNSAYLTPVTSSRQYGSIARMIRIFLPRLPDRIICKWLTKLGDRDIKIRQKSDNEPNSSSSSNSSEMDRLISASLRSN